MRSRSVIIEKAKTFLECKQGDSKHKLIVDTYNKGKNADARNYKVSYSDAWCATFISAIAILCGYNDIIPTECGCEEMINMFKKKGRWVENDAYVPSAADVIFYDWDDSGSGDCQGWSDHVGYVEKVVGKTITVIEGNKSKACGRRELQVNGRYIRGYGVPAYDETKIEVKTETKIERPVEGRSNDYKRDYVTTDEVCVHKTPDINNGSVIRTIPKGRKVRCYGYYKDITGRTMLNTLDLTTGKEGWISMKCLKEV